MDEGGMMEIFFSSLDFLNRFTPSERASLRAAAQTDEKVADFSQLASAAQEIANNDPVTLAGMDYLVSVGLLTRARADEILGG
jgi:hypothetical protein